MTETLHESRPNGMKRERIETVTTREAEVSRSDCTGEPICPPMASAAVCRWARWIGILRRRSTGFNWGTAEGLPSVNGDQGFLVTQGCLRAYIR